MYGHRVLNHFETMSYFITRSWFKNEELELSEDNLTTIYNEESCFTRRSKMDYSEGIGRLTQEEGYSTASFSINLNET